MGGLLTVQVGAAGPATLANTVHFAAYDGNGNVAALVSSADGSETARYEYGPFGEVIRATGPMAKVNPVRFSTQYADDVTGDVKYKHRDLDIDQGRFLSRDPAGEIGSRLQRRDGREVSLAEEDNLYRFAGNNGINQFDKLGLRTCCCNGQRIDATLVVIGKMCEGQIPNGDWDHAWLEVDGSSAGFAPRGDTPGIWNVPGEVRIPEIPFYINGPKRCEDIRVDPCSVNVQAAKARIWNAIWHSHFNPPLYNVAFYNCYKWAHDMAYAAAPPPGHRECGNNPHEWE